MTFGIYMWGWKNVRVCHTPCINHSLGACEVGIAFYFLTCTSLSSVQLQIYKDNCGEGRYISVPNIFASQPGFQIACLGQN